MYAIYKNILNLQYMIQKSSIFLKGKTNAYIDKIEVYNLNNQTNNLLNVFNPWLLLFISPSNCLCSHKWRKIVFNFN